MAGAMTAQEQEKEQEQHRPSLGLPNLGNTCCLNAVVQALAHAPPFVRKLTLERAESRAPPQEGEGEGEGEGRDDVRGALFRLIGAMLMPAAHQHPDPRPLLVALSPHIGAICRRQQLDADEVFSTIVDLLRCGSRPPLPALAPWAPATARRRLLSGELHQTVACCGRGCSAPRSARTDVFATIAAALPPAATPETTTRTSTSTSTLLDAHFADERVEGWRCSAGGCGATEALLAVRLWRLPKVLTVCVKRFGDHGSVLRGEVRPDLTLGAHALARWVAPSSPAHDDVAAGATYHLVGVVCHHGGSQQGGHYVSVVTRPHWGGVWHLHDDDLAHKYVGREPPDCVLRTCYLLLYSKTRRVRRDALLNALDSTTVGWMN
jgi:uncharacterized UBP type Zn finger protein